MSGSYGSLATLRPWRSRRSSTFDKTGGNFDCWEVAPGETAVLLDVPGAGIVKHIWITLHCERDPMYRRGLVLRAYWDGSEHPSIEAPIGDFFGQGWGQTYPFLSGPIAAAPQDGRALVCYLPMPFAKGARIEIENQCAVPLDRLYFYVDYDELPELPPDLGRLHAQYRQELTSPKTGDAENEWEVLGPYSKNPSDQGNYLWCEAEGHGHFAGVNYYVNSPTPMWYGEGDDMFLIDGEPWPGVHGTGTEDYFNTSWSPNQLFMHPSFGIAYVDGRQNGDPTLGWIGRTHLYRFHLDDPIRFTTSLRASIEHGHANCLTLDLASVAYWYQTMPSRPLVPMPAYSQRVPKPELEPVHFHRWRHAWRQEQKAKGRSDWGKE